MNRIYHFLLLAAAVATLFSCTDYQEMDVPEGLRVDATELSFSSEAGNHSVTVKCGSQWTIASMPDWVSVQSIVSGLDPYQWSVSFAIKENNEYDREGRITFQSSSGTEVLPVTQQGRKGKYVAVESVSIPQSLTLTEGDTQKLTPTILPLSASVKTVTWKSSAPTYATVDENGVVSAVSAGWATVTVTTDDGAKTSTCNVTVKAKVIPVTGVSLDKTSLTLTEEETYSLTATVAPANATDKSVTWTSSNTAVATVSNTGVVTAVKAGSATISVTTTDGGKKATCSVTVNPIHVTGVTLNKTSLTLTIGETETLTATVSPANAADKSVTWSSGNTSVATVSSSGLITAKAVGTTTITVTTTDGGKKATCSVTVDPIHVTGVSLNKANLTLIVGETEMLTATVSPADATDKSVTWSSNNTSVATVSSSGVVTAKAVGNATITVTTNDGSKKATCSVKVNPVSVTGVSLDYTSLTMNVGNTQALTATVSPSDATDKSVTWSSSNTSVATVSASGVVTAKAAGSATITVTTNDGGWTATCAVTVNIPVTGVSVTPTSLTLNQGETQSLTATVTPSNAADKSVSWSSSNTSVATVSSSGVVTATGGGTATVTVTTNDGGFTATCAVTVIVPVTGVSLDKTTLTMSEGDTKTLTATVTPSNATDKEVSWSTDDASVVTVTTAGVVIAKAAGTAVVTVTTHDGAKTASCAVTVKPRVTGVSLNNSSISLTVGGTQTLTATVTPADALDKSVTWSSSNTSVATVSSYGVVTAKAVGNATVTVTTNDGGKTATCAVTVTPVSVTGVSLNKSSLTLYEKESETLVATVTPSNATNKSVTWSSSNSSVASVNSNGKVTALAAGSTVITVTTNDGGKKATCSVTVKSDPYGAVDLGLSVKWASYNYGASSVTAKGGYYMWGDPNGTAQPLEFTPPSVSSISGTQYDIVRQHWGGSWRIPTRSEINELYSNCSWSKTTVNGVSVLKVTGPNGAYIYLPFTGYGMPADGPVGTVQVTDSSNAYMMSAEASGGMVYVYYFTPSGGRGSVSYNAAFVKFPIRPVK